MKRTIANMAVAFAVLSLVGLPAYGEAAKREPQKMPSSQPAPGSQQERMKNCNAEAKKKNLRGEERRSFMSSCLRKPT